MGVHIPQLWYKYRKRCILKRYVRRKCHSFACGGVGKSDFVGVEKESLCLFAAVECVAKYRIVKSVLVGAVNTELVSATCLGIKINSWEFGIEKRSSAPTGKANYDYIFSG